MGDDSADLKIEDSLLQAVMVTANRRPVRIGTA